VDNLKGYDVWAAVATEVEVDALTGEMNVVRADLIEDTGVAISPEVKIPIIINIHFVTIDVQVDVGQVEGGYVMGLGMWTTERAVYHPDTGK